MEICVTREDKNGNDVSMWIRTNYQALNDYYKHRDGTDVALARMLFPEATEEEIKFITADKENL